MAKATVKDYAWRDCRRHGQRKAKWEQTPGAPWVCTATELAGCVFCVGGMGQDGGCFVLVEWDRMEAVLCWWNGTGWRLFCVGGMGQDGGCFVLVEWDRMEAVLCWWNGTGWRLFLNTHAAWYKNTFFLL